jgi:hypothetical protein
LLLLSIKIPIFYLLGLYRFTWVFYSIRDTLVALRTCIVATLAFAMGCFVLDKKGIFPGVITGPVLVLDGIFVFLGGRPSPNVQTDILFTLATQHGWKKTFADHWGLVLRGNRWSVPFIKLEKTPIKLSGSLTIPRANIGASFTAWKCWAHGAIFPG